MNDPGWLIHSAIAAASVIAAIFVPVWVFVGLLVMVMWYTYEYGQAHMKLRERAKIYPHTDTRFLNRVLFWGAKKHLEWIAPAVVAWALVAIFHFYLGVL